MNKCTKCGKEFEGKFCPNCGASSDGKPHCPKCGADIQPNAKFCNECGFSLEQESSTSYSPLKSIGKKIKSFFSNVWIWIKKHIALTAIISFVLVAVIVLISLIPVFTSIFKINKVSKINLGDTKAQVKEILGEPFAKESKDAKWVYYEKDYIKLASVNDDLSMDDIEDFDDFEDAIEDELEAEEKKLSQKFKKITVDFEKNNGNWTVKSILLDMQYSLDILKPSKKSIENLTLLSGEIAQYTTETSFPITYEAEYTDGSYVKAKTNASYQDTKTEKDDKFWSTHSKGSTISIKWSNDWCDSHVSNLPIKANTNGYIVEDNTVYIVENSIKNLSEKNEITNIVIKDSVTNLDSISFEGFSELSNLTIGKGITKIPKGAFKNCKNLKKVNYLGTIDSWAMIYFNGYDSNPTYYAKDLYINDVLVTEANITTATKISDSAFYNCSSLASVTIGDSVTSIGSSAFSNCSNLQSITIGDSVTSIGNYAFFYCSSLESITIPDSVTSIGDSAFYNCSSLESVTIGEGVTSIGSSAFSGCSSLESITVDENNTNYASQDGILYNKSKTKFIHIPNSIKGNVTIPNSITTISSYAFSGCTNLESITIPNSVTSIGKDAFYKCSSLESVTIGSGVTSIGDYAFWYCSNLKIINYNGTKAQWKAITKGNNWNSSTGKYTIHCTDGDIAKS